MFAREFMKNQVQELAEKKGLLIDVRTKEEYEEYLEVAQIFSTPEMEKMKERLEAQDTIIAALASDAEYTTCMLEAAGII